MNPGDSKNADGRTYNILSIDGGPAALIQVRLLRHMEETVPGFLASTDVFCGTSDGAMLALFLASRMPEEGLSHEEALAVLDDAIIYSNTTLSALNAGFLGAARAATGLGPLNRMSPLNDVLEQALGDMRIGQLRRGAIAASFDMNAWHPHVFHWFPTNLGDVDDNLRSSTTARGNRWSSSVAVRGQQQQPYLEVDAGLKITDVILATSSLPVIISTYGDQWGHHYLDGAFIANNPSMIAISKVLEVFFDRRPIPTTDLVTPVREDQLRRLRVLSLGTNDCASEEAQMMSGRGGVFSLLGEILGISADSPGWLPWGWLRWVITRPMLLPDLLYQGQNSVVAEECRTVLGKNCHYRYAPEVAVLDTVKQALFGGVEKLGRQLDAEAAQLWAPSAQDRQNLVRFINQSWL